MRFLNRKIRFFIILPAFFCVFGVNASAVEITIVTTTGKTVSVDMKPEETVADLKDFVFDVTRIHQGTQRIYKGTVQLEDEKQLAFYGIKDGDTLRVRRGAGIPKREDEGGGFLKVMIAVAVLVGLVVAAKKLLFKGGEEESTS